MFRKKDFTNNSLIGLASLASGLFITGCDSKDQLSNKEMKIRKKFQEIITVKENEFPFSWNDNKFSPPV